VNSTEQRSKAEEIEAYAAVLALEDYQRDASFPHLILIQTGLVYSPIGCEGKGL
jgi:hypothetical protein